MSGGDWGYVSSGGGAGGSAGEFRFLPLGESETGEVHWGTSVHDGRGRVVPDPANLFFG